MAEAHAKASISLVVPCHNEAEVFRALRQALVGLADRLAPRYGTEFILVDDGSRDGTWEQMVAFAAADPRVRAISLSRNFGQQAALTCGYDLASGSAVVSLDADLQDPPEVVLELVREWEKGADVVFAVRRGRQGERRFKRWSAASFYRLIRVLTRSGAPIDSGDFRLMSHRSVAALRRLRERNRYVRGMVGWLGFRTAVVPYQRRPRASGATNYSLSRMLGLALDAVISSSALPLRLTYVAALAASLPFLGYLGWALVRHVFFGAPLVPGWSSLILSLNIFGFLILFCLGIIGEYVGRTYEEAKNRPLYLIREALGAEVQSTDAGT